MPLPQTLRKKGDAFQRATMLHCLGPIVQHIFNTLSGEHKTLEEVETALSGHFAQKAEESIDTYLTSLRELVKSCDFRTLKETLQLVAD